MIKRIGWPKLLGRIAWIVAIDFALCSTICFITLVADVLLGVPITKSSFFTTINGVAAIVAAGFILSALLAGTANRLYKRFLRRWWDAAWSK